MLFANDSDDKRDYVGSLFCVLSVLELSLSLLAVVFPESSGFSIIFAAIYLGQGNSMDYNVDPSTVSSSVLYLSP